MSLSHPLELTQLLRLPPLVEYNRRKTSASASEQSGPDTSDTESAHSEKLTVPGMHSSSLPLKSKTRRCDSSRKLDGTIPVSRLSSIHRPVNPVAVPNSAGTSPVSSLSPSPRNSSAVRLPSSGTMGTLQAVVPECQPADTAHTVGDHPVPLVHRRFRKPLVASIPVGAVRGVVERHERVLVRPRRSRHGGVGRWPGNQIGRHDFVLARS